MHLAYVDDAGDVQTLVSANSLVPPVFAFGAIALRAESLPDITREFLALKRAHFRGKMRSQHLLDDVLVEIKGTELRAMIRGSHGERRVAFRFIHGLLLILERYEVAVFGRVWVKPMNTPMDGQAVNGYSIQSICETFQHLLESRGDEGLVVIDSSSPGINAKMSHSIFTHRFRAAGDKYSRLLELPTFGHSNNHVGLQIADIVATGLLTPMAGRAYCIPTITGVHVHRRYDEVKARFAARLGSLQHRYLSDTGTWTGGVIVSDAMGRKHGGHLFHPACDARCAR